MKPSYFKQIDKPTTQQSYHDCKKYCKQDDKVDLVHFDDTNKTCQCFKQVNHKSKATDEFGDLTEQIKIDPVAFWVTFSFFLLFILILIFFLYPSILH